MPTSIILLKGEKKPVYASITVTSPATITYGSATFTLKDASGGVILNAVSATGTSGTGTALVTVWYNLDTAALTTGYYYGVMAVTVTGSDSIQRVEEIDFDVYVRAV